jgi:lipopolysaccharide transport system permease protein
MGQMNPEPTVGAAAPLLAAGRALWPLAQLPLIRQLATRDVAERYRGQWLGWAWLVLVPLLMVAVYTLVLRHAMGVRWGGTGPGAGLDTGWVGDLDFAVRLMCALMPFNWLAECVSRAPRLVSDVPHLVKKVVFPLEVLPWVTAAAALVPLAASLVVTLAAQALAHGDLPATVLWLPLVWLPLLPLGLGLMWLLSAVGTYAKDVAHLVAPALGALLFLSPVFYELRTLPEGLREALAWSPLAVVMEQTRAVVMGQAPDPGGLLLAGGAGLALSLAGAVLFQRVRAGFADVV